MSKESDRLLAALQISCDFISFSSSEFSLSHSRNSVDRMVLLKPFGELVLVIELLKRWNLGNFLPIQMVERAWAERLSEAVIQGSLLSSPDEPPVVSQRSHRCPVDIY